MPLPGKTHCIAVLIGAPLMNLVRRRQMGRQLAQIVAFMLEGFGRNQVGFAFSRRGGDQTVAVTGPYNIVRTAGARSTLITAHSTANIKIVVGRKIFWLGISSQINYPQIRLRV